MARLSDLGFSVPRQMRNLDDEALVERWDSLEMDLRDLAREDKKRLARQRELLRELALHGTVREVAAWIKRSPGLVGQLYGAAGISGREARRERKVAPATLPTRPAAEWLSIARARDEYRKRQRPWRRREQRTILRKLRKAGWSQTEIKDELAQSPSWQSQQARAQTRWHATRPRSSS
jgi:hypothetical protein